MLKNRIWSGPFSANLLGALGAEVVKVESIQRIDEFRLQWARTYGIDPNWYEQGPGWNLINTNKHGITLDLNAPRGRELCLDLIKASDVLVENYSPRVMGNLGMDYPRLAKVNPGLVMVSMSCFGQTGPWRDFVGWGLVFDLMGGVAGVTGYEGGMPMYARGHSDAIAGMTAAFAILAALEERERTGRGQFIDLSQIESLGAFLGKNIIEYQLTGKNQPRMGNHHPVHAPHNTYPCEGEDAWVTIAVRSDDEWARLCRAMGRPEWVEDPHFATVLARKHNERVIDERVSEWTKGQDKQAVMKALRAHGVPTAVVLHPGELDKDPQLKARRMFRRMRREFLGEQKYPQFPIRFSDAVCEQRLPAPTLGQHNEEVLVNLLGVTADEMEKLREEKVIGDRPLGL